LWRKKNLHFFCEVLVLYKTVFIIPPQKSSFLSQKISFSLYLYLSYSLSLSLIWLNVFFSLYNVSFLANTELLSHTLKIFRFLYYEKSRFIQRRLLLSQLLPRRAYTSIDPERGWLAGWLAPGLQIGTVSLLPPRDIDLSNRSIYGSSSSFVSIAVTLSRKKKKSFISTRV